VILLSARLDQSLLYLVNFLLLSLFDQDVIDQQLLMNLLQLPAPLQVQCLDRLTLAFKLTQPLDLTAEPTLLYA
jgi:hypothetical protein